MHGLDVLGFTFCKGKMAIKKNIVYFFGISLGLIVAFELLVDGRIRILESIGENPIGVLFGLLLIVAVVFEPIILSDLVAHKIKRIPDGWLFVRGLLCGGGVFFVWAALYRLGMQHPGYELYLILLGWLFANAAAVWAVWCRNAAEQTSDGNAEKPAGDERTQ